MAGEGKQRTKSMNENKEAITKNMEIINKKNVNPGTMRGTQR